MKKRITRDRLAVAITILSMAVALSVVAASQKARAQDGRQDAGGAHQAKTQQPAANRKDVATPKLTEGKLKTCQARQKAIKTIMARIAVRAQKQVDLFNVIAERTEKFYTNKGKTLANYDSLAKDVAAKKAAAQTVVDTIKSSSTLFNCSGRDPKGFINDFKKSLKNEINALQAYKIAVKNLIIGVKSIQGVTSPKNGA